MVTGSCHHLHTRRSTIIHKASYDKILICLLEEGYNADTLYLDFSKASDKVNFDILMKNIKAAGIVGKFSDWLKVFLLHRKQTACKWIKIKN